MAINSLDVPGEKTISKLPASTGFKPGAGNLSSCRLVKIDFATEGSICSAASKRGRKKNTDSKSPYLSSDNVHLLSQVTEKTFIHKKDTEFHSSFPLAVNIYKASSDEFRDLKKANKKQKKSVLTLPNDQAPMPLLCTVSDMNDSEYFNQDEDRRKLKKRNPVPRNRKSRPIGRDYKFYDRDARYCSQMNINLDCSSTDMIQNYNGDEKKTGKSKSIVGSKQQNEEKPNPHDVWTVLRNINRFQFRPSPPISEDSFITPKKNKGVKRRNNRKDMRVVGTCRTEEFAYISSIEVDSRSPHSFSKSSSFDRITVIDKHDDFSKICEEFEKRIVKTKNHARGASSNKPQIRKQNKAITNKNALKANAKNLAQKANNPKTLALEFNSKKQCNNNIGDTKLNKMQSNWDRSAINKTNNEFDKPLYKEIKDNQLSIENDGEVVEQEFIYSGNSGSSKAAANDEITNKRGRTKLHKVTSDELHDQFNGITKVILSKGPAILPFKQPETPKRKRQGPIVPSRPAVLKPTITTVNPKLTQTDIKRRLAKLKFPIVVLGKDQLSSNYEVPNPEPIQFHGLNEQVWPFMMQWQKGENNIRENTLKAKTEISHKKKLSPEVLEFNKTQKINRGFISPKQINENKKTINDSKNKNTGRVEQKRITPPAELQQQAQPQPKKPKPIRQFKEKMLKLLYKNSSIQNFAGENSKTGVYSDVKTKPANKISSNKVDASTDTHIIKTTPKELSRILTPTKSVKQVSTTKQPWAKARWASDFIDNVIKKIKNGVYYTHESKLPNQRQAYESKEAEIQTIATTIEDNPIMQSISKITIKKKQEPICIPGFDNNTLPALEIKTMNTNEISVKHCVTNIIVHFDVTVPNEPIINLKKSPSLIPLNVTASQTKIFKCKTSIINAMLPAELCSILPKMMWNIIESSQALALPPVPVDKSASHLSTISEITRCESPEPCQVSLFPHIRMSLELQKIINGRYPNKTVPKREHVNKPNVKYNRHLANKLLPRLSRSHLFDCEAKTSVSESLKSKQTKFAPVEEKICKTQLNTFKPYHASDRNLIPAYKRFDLTSLQTISNYITDKISTCSRVFNCFFDNNITINLTTTNDQGFEDCLSLNIGKLMSANSKDSVKTFSKRDLPAIQYVELKVPSDKNVENQFSANSKTKKKGFIKLYKKCKSTSNISAEKNSTSLNKITSLDDFFQALGTAKLFSGVFDNIYSHKILASLKEMKSWITDINPTQALLVLLLMNKKDTPNLLRFRPVLLQGIAVNRITRANELDMEIEVIEREHLNRLTQYEGISYLPASVENQDNLLEELCWIAKTTASDYQRTFNESSEKLLKSLLEKRKKLNPSYLRVMARYVGLGLLKSPVKK